MRTHKIKAGETLSGIAEKYGVTVSAIQSENKDLIVNPNRIQAGWTIAIPDTKPTTGQQVGQHEIINMINQCLNDVEKLPSYKALVKVMGW